MKYIILAAGKGTRLHPLTLDKPKCLFNLGKETVIERTLRLIHKYDKEDTIVGITGFKCEDIGYIFNDTIHNPFYDITNSIASLFLADRHLNQDVCIINADIVFDKNLAQEITKPITESHIYMDTSIGCTGDYNVDTLCGKVVAMSKNLTNYDGEYAGITKLKSKDAQLLRNKISDMVHKGQYNTWYEDALVQLIFEDGLDIYYKDICNFTWAEIDTVDDLLSAKEIARDEENF